MSSIEWLFALLVGGMVIKDVQYVNDVYVIRGIAQAMCLIAALSWLSRSYVADVLVRYWIFFLYIFVLTLTSIGASSPFYVLFQVVSLLAIVLYSIMMVERRSDESRQTQIVVPLLAAICALSLGYIVVSPQLAFMQEITGGARFRGILGQPGGLGAVAGALFGLAIFSRRTSRLMRIGSVLAALACLYLTGSRTFWVGSIVALSATTFFYTKHRLAVVAGGIAAVSLLVGFIFLVGYGESASEDMVETARPESIENLTGRTAIWERAIDHFWERPFLGYGYALAHEAFHEKNSTDSATIGIWNRPQFTMHSGYFQSLLDSGGVGTLLYLLVIMSASLSMIRNDRSRAHPAVFYAIVFFSVSNFSETIIFTASTFPSVYFWYLAVFAVGLRYRRQAEPRSVTTRPGAVVART